MTGTNPTGDPPPTLPHEADSSGFVSPTYMRRKVLRAELEEIRASRKLREIPGDELDQALEEVDRRLPDTADALGWGRFVFWLPPIRHRLESWEHAERKAESEREWNDTSIRPPQCGLVGLALSGGGIRSATVCLGVMQKLASANVLRLVDYLSTVSGGGYIGSSWSGLLARSHEHRELVARPDFPFVHQAGPEGQVVEISRQRQNKEPISLVHVRDFANYLTPRGLRDQIRVPALLLRGLIINFLLVLPTILILSAVTLLAYGDAFDSGNFADLPGFVATLWLALACLVYLLLATGLQTARSWSWPRWLIDATIGQPERNGWRVRRNLLGFGAFFLLALMAVAAFESTQYPLAWLARSEHAGPVAERKPGEATYGAATTATPRAETVVAQGEGMASAAAAESARADRSPASLLLSKEFWSVLGAVAGVVSALVAGQAASSSSPRTRRIAFATVGILGPLALLLAYLWCASRLNVFAINHQHLLENWFGAQWIGPIYLGNSNVWAFIYIGIAIALWILMTLIVDINKTSLHNHYRDRLSRAFMFRLEPVRDKGASADARPGYWRTRHEDEIPLSRLCAGSTGGPYHLINAIVNSPDFSEEHRAGTETQRGRRADFFIFGPRYCGNERLGYCETRKLERRDPHMNLATAMAISAAAAAPNMGQKTFNPLLVFLMSMLNVRLGYWLRKPESVEQPDWMRWPVGPLYFLRELIGLPARRSSYVNLSDGGHLDNTGIFELLRRRCRYIIAIDAESDPQMRFNGLSTLQRLARIDLGVEVHFDVEDLRRDGEGLSRRHFALCDVIYERDADRTPLMIGKLLYIKSSLTGTEIEYIKEYAARNPSFPHETTGDQFFDEAQFEAYRALGEKMGNEVVERVRERDVLSASPFFAHLEDWMQPVMPLEKGLADLANRRRELTARLRADRLMEYRSEFWPPNNGHDILEMEERGDDFVYEDRPLWEEGEAPDPQFMELVNEQMQLMELALLQLRFDDPTNWNHQRNRGWRTMFRRWSRSEVFRKYWQFSVPYYSHGLEAFGVSALGLPRPFKGPSAGSA